MFFGNGSNVLMNKSRALISVPSKSLSTPSAHYHFSLDGKRAMTAKEWDNLRYEWNHVHGLTNVWKEGPLHGSERFRGGDFKSAPWSSAKTQSAAFHLNQKPLEFMRRLITATTNAGGVIWEPFGGLASASVAAIELGRHACVAEISEKFQNSEDCARSAFGRSQKTDSGPNMLMLFFEEADIKG
jgi:hypothetical protein